MTVRPDLSPKSLVRFKFVLDVLDVLDDDANWALEGQRWQQLESTAAETAIYIYIYVMPCRILASPPFWTPSVRFRPRWWHWRLWPICWWQNPIWTDFQQAATLDPTAILLSITVVAMQDHRQNMKIVALGDSDLWIGPRWVWIVVCRYRLLF
jgi:hypothetical protein